MIIYFNSKRMHQHDSKVNMIIIQNLQRNMAENPTYTEHIKNQYQEKKYPNVLIRPYQLSSRIVKF